MTTHTVIPGECLASIAERYGFTNPRIIYDHPANENLRRARPDPNVLLAGDQVAIPDRTVRTLKPAATEQRHRFVVNRERVYLRAKLVAPGGAPRAGLPYRVEYHGQVHTGTTGADGGVVLEVPPALGSATLVVTDGAVAERYTLGLGYLDPVTHEDGLRQRLTNLGYLVDVPGVPPDVQLRYAIHTYQHANDLPPTGYPDTHLYQKLTEHYCS